MQACRAVVSMPPIDAGRYWSFRAGTNSMRRQLGTWTSSEVTVSSEVLVPFGKPQVQDLSGKVPEFRYLSAERLFTVPSSATTFEIHEMLREHIQLPVSCLVLFPVARKLSLVKMDSLSLSGDPVVQSVAQAGAG